MKPIKIIKNRSDIGAGTRGSDMGIDAIEVAAITSNNDYFTRFPHEDVRTHNETIYNMVNATFAKRITHVYEQCQRVTKATLGALKEGYFPIVLSGDHSSALGTMSAVKARWPEQRMGVVWIDAHADLHSPYTSPSGNVHGMPLAAALSEDNLTCQVNDITEYTEREWSLIKDLGIPGPKIQPEDLVYFGVRDTEAPEDHLMNAYKIRNYMVHEMRYRGPYTCLDEALKQLDHCEHIYVSFDVDSLDCDLVSRGTGTPVSKGFDPDEVIEILKHIFDSGKVVCLEITEVNPLLDTRGNKMAETAFYILDAITTYIRSNVE